MSRDTDPTFGDLKVLREKMLRWAMRLTGARHSAEDLVQSAMLRMIARRHLAPTDPAGVDPWCRVVLTNEWRMGKRVDNRMPTMVSVDTGFSSPHVRHQHDGHPRQFDGVGAALTSPDNPFTAVYCRQVCAFLGFDSVELLALHPTNLTATQRSQRFRARRELQVMA
jgi:DNA-directed RNA polymerase specialized sigma24 family protein